MRKKIFIISLIVVITVSFNACTNEGKETQLVESGSPSAQEIINGVIESLHEIKTSKCDVYMTMDMTGDVNGENFDMEMLMNLTCTLDIENTQIKMDMFTSMEMPGDLEMNMEMEMYLIENMLYMFIDIPEMGPMWMKSEMPEGYLEQMSQVESQIELLKAAQVDVLGSERVGDIDCYVTQLNPDMDQVWRMVMQQAQFAGEIPDVDEEFLDNISNMLSSFYMKQWIAKDTFYLTKATVLMGLELTSEAIGLPSSEGDIAMDIVMDMQFYDYNEPVSIVLPSEADKAIEMPIY